MAGSHGLLSLSRYMYRCHLDVLFVGLLLAITFQMVLSVSPHRSLGHLSLMYVGQIKDATGTLKKQIII